MKDRSLIVLTFFAVVLGGLAIFSELKTRERAPSASDLGKYLLPELRNEETLMRIARIVIRTSSGSIVASAGNTGWSLDTKYGYPADFEAVRKFVTRLIDLKIADVVPEGADTFKKLSLIEPAAEASGPEAGILVSLQDSAGNPLVSAIFGKKHFKKFAEAVSPWEGYDGYADGRFVAVRGKGYMVADALHDLPEKDTDWVNSSLVNLSSSDIKVIRITGHDNTSLQLVRNKETNQLTLEDLAGNEEMDEAKVSSIGNFLTFLDFSDIADPTYAQAAMGFDKALTCEAETRDGRVYTVTVGGKQAETDNRHIRLAARYNPPAPATGDDTAEGEQVMAAEQVKLAQEIAALNARAETWTYAISAWKADDLTTDRDKLVREKDAREEKSPE